MARRKKTAPIGAVDLPEERAASFGSREVMLKQRRQRASEQP